jgi:D-glycero-alpha-D-manno-heptose-7-phosphate kinase
MSIAEATAPTRIDLAGGTLDIWPLYLFHKGATTVNVAINRRAWTRVETGIHGVVIESKDTLSKVEGGSIAEILDGPEPPLAAYVLRALEIEGGIRVTTHSRVPAGSGLGGSSALAVAIAAAAARAVGRELPREALWPLVRDAEAQSIGVPTGVQDYHAALRGGVLALHLRPGDIQVAKVQTDPGRVEESLALVETKTTRFSGINNWEVCRGQIEGNPKVRAALATIARCAGGVLDALVGHRYEDVGPLIAEEWEARKDLGAGVTTPEIDRIVEVALSCGAAAKVCGAGGGGMVAVWATPGQRESGKRERVVEALKAEGFRLVSFRGDLQGLEVELLSQP